jgi:hypothetical protein
MTFYLAVHGSNLLQLTTLNQHKHHKPNQYHYASWVQ